MYKRVVHLAQIASENTTKVSIRVVAQWKTRTGGFDGLTVGLIALAAGVVGAVGLMGGVTGAWSSAATWVAAQLTAAE